MIKNKYMIMGLLFFCIIGFAICFTLSGSFISDPVMPDGYRLLCSPEGKYCLWVPNSYVSGGFKIDNIFDSERKAIKYAIRLKKIRNEPWMPESDKYEWNDCDLP